MAELKALVRREDDRPRGKVVGLAPAGRELIVRNLGKGLSNAKVARLLGISAEAYGRLIEEDEGFAETHRQGLGELESTLVNILLELAKAGNAASAMFLLKSRCKYNDKAGEMAERDSRPAVLINLPAPLTPQQADALIQQVRLPPPQETQRV